MQHYTGIASKYYFWRTYDRQEIDHVEERDGNLYGYEFKYSPERLKGPPKAWSQNYRNAEFSVITRENFLSFVS